MYSSIYAWNTPKLNFTKNPWASLFSPRRLIKISKCSISLTHLDKCSKRLHHCSYFFILAFISADIFHKFTELHSTYFNFIQNLWQVFFQIMHYLEKNFCHKFSFFNRFTHSPTPPPLPDRLSPVCFFWLNIPAVVYPPFLRNQNEIKLASLATQQLKLLIPDILHPVDFYHFWQVYNLNL